MSIPGKRVLRFSSVAVGALVMGLAACSGQSGQPVAPILTSANPTQTPRTSPVTPAPTATPKPTPTPKPSSTPTAVAVSGAQAACVVTLGSSTYAFVPGTIGSPALNAGDVGLAEVKISSGAGILNRTGPTIRSARIAPNTQGPRPRAARSRGPHSFDFGYGGSPILPLNPAPQECAADVAHADLYIISYLSPTINVVHVDPATAAMTLIATYSTDASSFVGFSGGSAEVLGAAWDTADNGLIVATSSGYELYSGARAATPNTKLAQIATINPSENFGYNANTNQIWSPTYLPVGGGPTNAVLVNVAAKSQYALNPLPTGYVEPDQGAIDSSTNIAVASEEFNYTLYLVPLSQNVLDSPAAGQFTNPNVVTATMSTLQDNGCCPISDISIDSPSHLLFSTVEFGQGVGVVALPASGSGTPALGDYVFAALPSNTSGGSAPLLPGDPHAIATFNIGGKGPYGLTFDSGNSNVIVVDMRAALAAGRNSGDPHGTTLTAGTNLFYIPI